MLQNPGQYCAVLAFGLGGLAVYHCICRRWQQRRVFARRLLAGVLAFSCLFGIVHIGIGKFGQWNTDSDLVEEYINALALKEDLPEGDWRIDTYKTHDNLGLWLDKSCLQYFGSTAAPSILSFYPALGVKRDVRSQPELSNYALRGLLSVKYLLTTPKHQEQFRAEADEGWTYYDTLDGYVLYENENYVPMGFTYDYYLTETQYEDTVTPTRSNLLMRALVLTEEDAVAYGQYLTPLPTAELNDLSYTRYTQDCADRRATACTAFEMTSAGFHAEATLDRTNLMFFSVPYDDGFTAYVDGQENRDPAGGRRSDGSTLPRRSSHHRFCLPTRRHPPEPDRDPCRPARVPALRRALCLGRKEKTEALKKPPLQEATAQRKAQMKEGILWAPGITRSSALTAIMSTCAAPTLKATS